MSEPQSIDQLQRIAEAFATHGYVIVRGALSANEMSPILEQWERVREALRTGEVIDGMRRDNLYVHGKLPAPLGDVYRHPVITGIAQRLLGPDVALYLNRLNVKDQSFKDFVHMHQDIPYFNGRTHKINFFVAFQHVNFNNGGMGYVPGSHHLGILDRSTLEIRDHPELELIVPTLQPGDLVIADIRLWHSSVPNIQASDRVLLQMIFQPANDGSYYPLSVPVPQLVTGDWRTAIFTPWQIITENTGSQLIVGDESDAETGSLGAERNGNSATPIALVADTTPKAEIIRVGRVANATAPEPVDETNIEASAAFSPPPARELPELFTASTGPKQVWPVAEPYIDWQRELVPTARFLVQAGKCNVLLAVRQDVAPGVSAAAEALGLQVKGFLHVTHPGEPSLTQNGALPTYRPEDLPNLRGIDAVVVLCTVDFGLVIRRCEQYLRHDILFVPGAREAIVPQPIRETSITDWATRSTILTYLYVSGLRGHFAEFGTFWGRAYYASFYELQHWLQGNFYAFDSFAGLSTPDPQEVTYTNGDFTKGAYGFNQDSFRALADILDLPKERLITVPGFFDSSLSASMAQDVGIAPASLSVCRIDCDLLASTGAVLDFITPLLADGALIYFDDWRLCRADPNLGERGAALRWLKANPSFELVDFHSLHWQHQWFIFHRNRPA